MPRISTISIHSDTLWSIESAIESIQQRFADCMAPYASPARTYQRLREARALNAQRLGCGANGFLRALIDVAIEVSGEAISAREIAAIMRFADEILESPLTVVEGARETVKLLSLEYRLIIYATGELLEQERRIAGSGFANLFEEVCIVSVQGEHAFARLRRSSGVSVDQLVVVGRSLQSDIRPAIAQGSHAIHIAGAADDRPPSAETPLPHALQASQLYRRTRSICEVPAMIQAINGEAGETRA
jgi:putative hydrolase of the HAD superfamily